MEGNLLQDVYTESNPGRDLRNNIYKGRVLRVLPGIQSAFVDIGLPRAAFLRLQKPAGLPAADCRELHEGGTLLVQVVKDAFGSKGPQVTTSLSFSSRHLVYMPGSEHTAVSRHITDEAECCRLKELAETLRNPDEGLVLRTAATGACAQELQRDLRMLRAAWCRTRRQAEESGTPSLVYQDPPLTLRVVRDLMRPTTERVLIDCEHQHELLRQLVAAQAPEQAGIVELAGAGSPLFELANLEEQLEQALGRKVPLKSGGYLVIDQTEAMTTIDVNSGAFVGRHDPEDTAYRTNLEAAEAIPRQLRLRRLGGILVLDFIDMEQEEHGRQVLRTLEKGLALDPVPCQLGSLSNLGLVEMTRARRRESLRDALCEPCPHCAGQGVVKTAETVCLEVFRELARRANEFRDTGCLVIASQSVVDRLIDEEAGYLDEVALALGTNIRVNVEPGYAPGQFDVIRQAS